MGMSLPLCSGSSPCVNCGYCCLMVPCAFGKADEKTGICLFIEKRGERIFCGKYEEIINGSDLSWMVTPAFGAGCCSSLFNERRKNILQNR